MNLYAEKLTDYIPKYNPDAKIQWNMTLLSKNGNEKESKKYDLRLAVADAKAMLESRSKTFILKESYLTDEQDVADV